MNLRIWFAYMLSISASTIALVALFFLSVLQWRRGRTLAAMLHQDANTYGRRYREIFENAPDAIFIVQIEKGEYRFDKLNPAADKIMAVDGVQPAGMALNDLLASLPKDSGISRTLHGLAAHITRAVSSGMPVRFELGVTLNPGSPEQFFEFDIHPMADDDGISHVQCFAREITARKLHEQELNRRVLLEEKLSGFAASAPGFFFTYRHGADGSNAMPFASIGIHELFGISPADVATDISRMNLRIHPDDLQSFIQAIADSAANLSPLMLEFRVHHPAKGELWVESRARPQQEEAGSVVWHGFMHDISTRKQIERRLIEAHAFTEGVINAISDPIYVKDRQHRWLLLNDACCEMIGHGREKLIGRSDYDFFPKEQADEFWAGDERVFTSGEVDLNEEVLTSGKGIMRHIQTKKTPFAMHGEGFLIAVIRDITERKKLEDDLLRKQEGLAEAQRIGQMGSWELDIRSNILRWSDEVFRIFEIDPRLFGASYEAFLNTIHPDDRDAVDRAYHDSLENRKAYCIDHRLLFPDGRIKHVRECCESRYDEDGNPLRSHGTVQDITALKVTEQQLKDTQDMLRELVLSREAVRESERKRIAWEMHEELGQLLASAKMRMYGIRSQLSRQYPALGDDSQAILDLLDKSIKTIHNLVSDLRPSVLLHGIAPALEWLVAEFNKHPSIKCDLRTVVDTFVSEAFTTQIFRIAQESLEHISRYTNVTHLTLSWHKQDGSHLLTIRHDGASDGQGSGGEGAVGFFGIQERVAACGGEMRIYSSLVQDSVIEARFPDACLTDRFPMHG